MRLTIRDPATYINGVPKMKWSNWRRSACIAVSLAIGLGLWTPYGCTMSNQNSSIQTAIEEAESITLFGRNVCVLGPTRIVEDALMVARPLDVSDKKSREFLKEAMTLRQTMHTTPFFIFNDYLASGQFKSHYWEICATLKHSPERQLTIRMYRDLVYVEDSDRSVPAYGRVAGLRNVNLQESFYALITRRNVEMAENN